MSDVLSREQVRPLVAEWIEAGKQVAGPRQVKPDKVQYTWLTDADALQLDGFLRPANSIKEFIFPRHEKLYGYRLCGRDVELTDGEPDVGEQVIIGARPCDAAALPILDHVFNWDYKDEFYNRRRAATTIVTFACTECDSHCFCTSVGLSPHAEKGSDAILFELGDGSYEVRCLTDKGRALFAGKTSASDQKAKPAPAPEKTIDPKRVREFLKENFESPFWQEQSLRCMACGACAYTCPTCHCFDIVDEGNAAGGVRAKNWDCCQYSMFTLHASGHNPRTVQPQRQRQRVLHKFEMYPDKFGEILCTGCGNCTRNCPVGLGIMGVLEAMESAGAAATRKG